MKRKQTVIPTFNSESDEAEWWASPAGRQFLKQKSAEAGTKGKAVRGSLLVASLNKPSSVQIALRLPESDLAKARKIAARKGIGYQTLLKMLLHEGLQREARRA